MKYIVPLFRQDAGRVNVGLVNWDLFQAGFRMVMRGERFAGVAWDPWWHERKSGDRRGGQRRAIPERRSHDKTGHRLCSDNETFQPLRLLHNRRANVDRRNGSDRRALVCQERSVGFGTVVRALGKGPLSDENVRLLVRMCAALTTRETYENWKRVSTMTPFFREPDWDDKENHEKFRVFAVASFLELLRPGSIYWKGQSPSAEDLRSVSRVVSLLGRASEKARLQSVRAFLEREISLERMRKILSGESVSDKKTALLLVRANHRLKPKEFYAKLRGPLEDLGIELSSNPNSYPKQIERLKKQAQAYLATFSRS